MPCYHPLRRFAIGTNPETGKSIGKVVPYDVDVLLERQDGSFVYESADNICYAADSNGVAVPRYGAYVKRAFTKSDVIPCGHCVGCRLDYSKQWAERLMLELPYHAEAWFLTLTYNDAFVPLSADGSELTLRKSDFQLFMKRLRKVFPAGALHYYCCGEYGSLTMRPHYHAIVFFDVPLCSVPGSVNRLQSVQDGHEYYTNSLIERLWYVPGHEDESAGFHYISSVNWETCSYVTKYVTKKLTGPYLEEFKERGIETIFSVMSRRPAIGRNYFEEHGSECYEDFYMVLNAGGKPRNIRPPRYYDTLFDIEHHEELCDYKAVRKKVSEDSIAMKLSQTDLSYLELLAAEEANFLARASQSMKNKNTRKKV